MNYRDSLEFLHDLTKFGFNFGLERIETLLRLLGNPEKELQVVHIGGTNGKGSTAAMVASILIAGGKKTGLFTSPHLDSYRERIRINNEMISEADMAGLLTEIKPLLEKMVAEGYEHPTEFEVITAVALLYFRQQDVELAVVEVGLGGLIDSTNVVHPLVSVITNVGMDHMEYLGSTLEEITRVKVGIIKERSIAITAAAKPEVLAIIEEACREKDVSLIKVGTDVTYSFLNHSRQGQQFSVGTAAKFYPSLEITLMGKHQVINAAMAVAVIEALKDRGIDLPQDAVAQGLKHTKWPARLELLPGTPPVLVDAAHNFDGALTLAAAIKEYFPSEKVVLLIGMLADKEREKVLSVLAPLAEKIVVTRPNSPRAGEWRQLAREARLYTEAVMVEEQISQAVDRAIEAAGTGYMVCVTGSFYMVAEARQEIINRRANIAEKVRI